MGRTKTPRRPRRPRPVNPLAHLVAMQGAARLTLDDRIQWQANLADALAAVRTGRAQQPEWAVLFDGINVVEELCLMRLARDDADVVPRAQAAVCAVLDRLQATGMRAARADELHALGDLVAAFADLMAGITHQQRFEADSRVAARVRRVLSSRAPLEAGVRVVDASTIETLAGRGAAC